MLLLAVGLTVFRSIYLDAVPADVLPHDAAVVLYDTILRFLRAGLRTVFVLGLVVAAGAFLTGQSVTATRTRQGVAGAIGLALVLLIALAAIEFLARPGQQVPEGSITPQT